MMADEQPSDSPQTVVFGTLQVGINCSFHSFQTTKVGDTLFFQDNERDANRDRLRHASLHGPTRPAATQRCLLSVCRHSIMSTVKPTDFSKARQCEDDVPPILNPGDGAEHPAGGVEAPLAPPALRQQQCPILTTKVRPKLQRLPLLMLSKRAIMSCFPAFQRIGSR